MAYTHVQTTSDLLDSIQIVNEQIIFVTDTEQIYLDINNTRNHVTLGEVTYYDNCVDIYRYSALKTYHIGDLCYYSNNNVNGWYVRIEEGVPGIWNSTYWQELAIVSSGSIGNTASGYSFGDKALSFGEQSVVFGTNNFIYNSPNSIIGGIGSSIVNMTEDDSQSNFVFGNTCIIASPAKSGVIFGTNNEVILNEDIQDSTSSNFVIEGNLNSLESSSLVHVEGKSNVVKNGFSVHIEGQNNSLQIDDEASSQPFNIHIEGGGQSAGNTCNLSSSFDNNINMTGQNNTLISYKGFSNVSIEGENNAIEEDDRLPSEGGHSKDIHIEGQQNVISISDAAQHIENIHFEGKYNTLEFYNYDRLGQTPQYSLDNIFINGEHNIANNSNSMITGYYNNNLMGQNIIFGVGDGTEDKRHNIFSITEGNVQFDGNIRYGQYDLFSPMNKLFSYFSIDEINHTTPLDENDPWKRYKLKGYLIKDTSFSDFNDTLLANPVSWQSDIGIIAPTLYFVIKIQDETEMFGSIIIQCAWIADDENYSLSKCWYQTCEYDETLPHTSVSKWTNYSEKQEPDTHIVLEDSSVSQKHRVICYDPIFEVEVLSVNSNNKTFTLKIKMKDAENGNLNESYVELINVQFPNTVSASAIQDGILTNDYTTWNIGSTEYDIQWYTDKQIMNTTMDKLPFTQEFVRTPYFIPSTDDKYKEGSVVLQKHETEPILGSDNPHEHDTYAFYVGRKWRQQEGLDVVTHYPDPTYIEGSPCWLRLGNPPIDFWGGESPTEGRYYYSAGTVVQYNNNYYYCIQSYHSGWTWTLSGDVIFSGFPDTNENWIYISTRDNTSLLHPDTLIATLQDYENRITTLEQQVARLT